MFSASSDRQRGNVMIYILIAIVLFGALTMILARQNAQSDNESTSNEQITLQVNDILSFASAAQSVVDQMVVSGSELDDLVFVRPADATFNTAPNIHKVFHPAGGGLNYPSVNTAIFTGTATNPVAGWYMGRFNNVEWTKTSANDVILTAHQISQPVCAALNKKLTGDATIPALGGTGNPQTYLIAQADSGIANAAFTSAVCAGCNNRLSLCVSNTGGTMWSFYSIIGGQ